MSLTDLVWLATARYGLHVLEEYQLNWRDWARAVIGLPVQWSDFYVVNSLVIVIGIVAANLAASWPGIALALPALMLINAIFFHIVPMMRTHGRFSPGLFTAIVLFFPVAIASYWRAHRLVLLWQVQCQAVTCQRVRHSASKSLLRTRLFNHG